MAVATGPIKHGARAEDHTVVVALAAASVLLTAYALYAFYAVGMDRSDFFLFYRSGRAWLQGQTLYPLDENPNLNPPLAIAVLFAPLALLPYAAAQTVWTALGVVSLVLSVLAIRRALGLTPWQTVGALAVLHVTHAAFLVWLQGQVTWILLYPVTRAWLAFRGDRPVRAGLWLAPAIAIKPILALVALALPMSVWVPAGVVSAAVTALAIARTGWAPWATWLRVGSDVSWIAWPPNASLWGVAARLQSGELKGLRMGDIHPLAIAAVAVALAAGWILAARTTASDRRFALALFWMVIASPLGWIYYLPLGTGAIVASWPTTPAVWLGVACLVIPFHIIEAWFSSPLIVRTFGCAYGFAAAFAFALWTSSDRSADPASRAR